MRPLGLHVVRKQAEIMELETRRYYERAAQQATDVSIRKLLGDLAMAERKHSAIAESLEEKLLTPDVLKEEEAAHRRLFVLQIVQPGLAGLMDGSVSTLAPVFCAAFATKTSWDAFLVGMAELFAISFVRNKYMDTPFFSAAVQVIFGGALVFAVGILIGSS